MKIPSSLLSVIVFRSLLTGIVVSTFASQAQAAPVVFSGADAGATSFAAMTNSQAAAASFDAATGQLGIIDFESALPAGVTLSGGSIANTSNGFENWGDNTTAGGDYYLRNSVSSSMSFVTFDFVTPIAAFGAYITGLQGFVVGQQTLSYASGASQTVDIPVLNGGGAFLGFTEVGASISSVSIELFGDNIGIDDVRYGSPVPEPTALALATLGGLGIFIRRKNRA